MLIFRTPENFCGFLFYASVVVGIIGVIVNAIIYRNTEPEEETEDVQAFIDGIENAIDNGWEISEADYEEYCRVTEKREGRENK